MGARQRNSRYNAFPTCAGRDTDVGIQGSGFSGYARRGKRRIAAWNVAVVAASGLAACGGGSATVSDGDGGPDAQRDVASARLVGGIEGLSYTSSTTYSQNGTSQTDTSSGVTDAAGRFEAGIYQQQTCGTDIFSQQSSCTTGPAFYGSTTLSVCGQSLPTLPAPKPTTIYQVPGYTAWDLFNTQTAIDNFAAVALMANTNAGDPAKTGIVVSAALQTGSCHTFDWNTANIQRDAASLQTAARGDGLAHDWPGATAVSDFLTTTYLCARSGLYGGQQVNTETPGYPAGTLSGPVYAIVDAQGSVTGSFDFSLTGTPPVSGAIPFAGTVAIAPGGVGTVSYTAPADAPLPNMTLTMRLLTNGASVSWQTADGTLGGSTASAASSGGTNPGLTPVTHTPFVKYRFLMRDVSYTRPGHAAPDNFVMTMDVGYDDSVEGSLWPWPPLPKGASGGFLLWRGSMSGQTVNVQWYPATSDKSGATTSEIISLSFDSGSTTLTGQFIGQDGGTFITFTTARPLQGCRM
jgi:hypothetical protein